MATIISVRMNEKTRKTLEFYSNLLQTYRIRRNTIAQAAIRAFADLPIADKMRYCDEVRSEDERMKPNPFITRPFYG